MRGLNRRARKIRSSEEDLHGRHVKNLHALNGTKGIQWFTKNTGKKSISLERAAEGIGRKT